MSNRVLLGKNTNSNHGHSGASPGFGLYISRPGKDVTTCTADELIFNTDNGSATSLGRIISLYQLIPLPVTGGGTDSTVTTSVAAGGTATIDLSSIDFGIDFGFLGFGLPTPSATSNTSGSTTSFGYSTSSSLETITIQNFGSTTLSIKSYAAPRYSNLAFF